MRAAGAALIFAASAGTLSAEAPFLGFPLDCRLGETCYIEDLMDRDPGPAVTDYACGLKARADHGGTDFALLSFEQMNSGVAVLAAADGVVAAMRDGVADRAITPETRDLVDGRECGNAVRIVHDNGFQTLYCHMRIGSVAVAQGQRVKQGQRLGLVGLSGLTNYPHLHMTVLRDNERVDPFRPNTDLACEVSDTRTPTLWLDPPDYQKTGLFTAGFAAGIPTLEEVRSGESRRQTLTPDDSMVVYGHSFHAQNGDIIRIEATGPAGVIFDHTHLVKDAQAEMFRAFGRKAPPEGWAAGRYRGRIVLTRNGQVLAVRHTETRVK